MKDPCSSCRVSFGGCWGDCAEKQEYKAAMEASMVSGYAGADSPCSSCHVSHGGCWGDCDKKKAWNKANK